MQALTPIKNIKNTKFIKLSKDVNFFGEGPPIPLKSKWPNERRIDCKRKSILVILENGKVPTRMIDRKLKMLPG